MVNSYIRFHDHNSVYYWQHHVIQYSISLIEFNDINYFRMFREKSVEYRDVVVGTYNREIFCELRMIFHFHDDAIMRWRAVV